MAAVTLGRDGALGGDVVTGRLEGRVAVITGGASGIGRATVHRFLDDGAAVVAADLNPSSISDLESEVSASGAAGRLRVVRADVTDEGAVSATIDAAVESFGRLDCVFNNAGVGGAFGALTELEVEDWDYTFEVLVRGVFLGLKHGARAMRAQGTGGTIINTASVAGLSGGAGPQAYSAAKSAVINLTKSAALELAPDRIRVNAICPGIIMTPLLHRGRETEVGARIDGIQPWPDRGDPEHIAGAAAFLASDDSMFVTGHALVVDGGLTAAGPNLGTVLPTRPVGGGLVGVNRGSTGEGATIRRRPEG